MPEFYQPWLWLGALAWGLPVWLHLRRRPERNLLRFSTLRFLDDTPLARPRPWRLRDLLLFALRTLGLLLLVGAFAWPYLPADELLVVKESRVYLLDNTLSHQAGQGFQKARDRILNDLARAKPDTQVAVVELTSQARVVVAFSDDRETARRRLAALEPSHQRGSYLAGMRLAQALLEQSLGAAKRIVVCADNQANQWGENLDAPPFLRQTEVELGKTGPLERANLSLAEPRAQRIALGDKSLVNFTVNLAHQGPATEAQVNLRANGQLIFSRSVPLEQQPEVLVLQAQWPAEPADWLQGEVDLQGAPDELAGDNRVFFSLPPVREGSVALLAQSPFLRLALSPEVMRGHWTTRVLDPSRLLAELSAGGEADVLCVESHYLQLEDARKLVWRYLGRGRGVVLLVNRVTPVIAALLRELGFEVVGSAPAQAAKTEKFHYVFFNHPVFYPFLAPDYGDLMEIEVTNPARLRPTQGLPLVISGSGDGLFFQGAKPGGRLFVAAFGLDRAQTTWPLHVTFIPFLDLCLGNARAGEESPALFEPGETTVVRLPDGVVAREAVWLRGGVEWARLPVTDNQVQIRLPDQPGLYGLAWDQPSQLARVLAVNPSPKESVLTYLKDPEALRAWQLPKAAETSPPVLAATALHRGAILRQDWWWWMLLLACGLLALEAAVAVRQAPSSPRKP